AEPSPAARSAAVGPARSASTAAVATRGVAAWVRGTETSCSPRANQTSNEPDAGVAALAVVAIAAEGCCCGAGPTATACPEPQPARTRPTTPAKNIKLVSATSLFTMASCSLAALHRGRAPK